MNAIETKDWVQNRSLAVISCVHGNLFALEAVFADIVRRDIQHVVCLGDFVGYGPQPNEVIAFIKQHRIRSIMGCWDENIVLGNSDCGCEFTSPEEMELGRLAFEWTASEINAESVDFLSELPGSIELKSPTRKMLFVHGSPKYKTEYLTLEQAEIVQYVRAAEAGCDVLFCGHTHVPFVKNLRCDMTLDIKTMDRAIVKNHKKFKDKLLINAGSVGEPRHGGLEATYIVYHGRKSEVEICGVPYPHEKTIDLMWKKNVPPTLIDRFQNGQEMTGKNKDIYCSC